jgi:hypothetical protein
MEAASNDSNYGALAYGVRLNWFPRSVDVYKLQSADKLDQWKKVASVPAQSTSQFLWESVCFMVCNDKQLVLVKCHANNQDLPSIFPSSVRTGSDLKTNEISMAGLAGCTFEIKFEQSCG